MNEKGIAKKGIIIILLICFALIATSCGNGQTEVASNQSEQGTIVSVKQTGNHVEPIKVNMPGEQKKALDTFFSNFSEAYLKPFSMGNLSDDELISFALNHLVISKNHTYAKFQGSFSATEVEKVAARYFGKSVSGEENKKYDGGIWVFKDGVYRTVSGYGAGEMSPFSQIDELWDRGDGTFTVLVSVYRPLDGWEGDRHGNPEEWIPGPPGELPDLEGKYRATFRLVHEEYDKRYILIEYLKESSKD